MKRHYYFIPILPIVLAAILWFSGKGHTRGQKALIDGTIISRMWAFNNESPTDITYFFIVEIPPRIAFICYVPKKTFERYDWGQHVKFLCPIEKFKIGGRPVKELPAWDKLHVDEYLERKGIKR